MKTLFSSLKQLKLRQIITVTLASLLLMISTAYSSVETQAANLKNQPLQIGGINNPYKSGGDKYTKNENAGKQTSLMNSQQLIAATQSKLLYPGAETFNVTSLGKLHKNQLKKHQNF